jgi:primosomal protein N' (replication factor Y)
MEKKRYCSVAVNFPRKNSVLTYGQNSDFPVVRGDLVMVPLGKRREKGCVLIADTVMPEIGDVAGKIKDVYGPLTDEIHPSGEELQLFEWMSRYYHYPIGKLIFDCLPPLLKRPRKLEFLSPLGGTNFTLTPAQQKVFDSIERVRNSGHGKFLIHGITGSGKTYIYLELIRRTLAEGKSALFLLPEINLTPQFLKLFNETLDAPIFAYHSEISDSDKFGLWKLLQEDEAPKVIIGVRSSVFLPLKNAGLIIVDEEHDSSFKQDDRCPYNGRDVAVRKAAILNIPVVLGSATPAVETWSRFRNTETYFELPERVEGGKLPEIELLDERMMKDGGSESWPLMKEGIDRIRQAVNNGEQALVFINRLGYSNYLQCRSCGHTFHCPNCSVNLKFHKERKEISCKYCDFKTVAPTCCPECGCLTIVGRGFGTEKVKEILDAALPDARIERFDRDEIKTLKALKNKLDRFHDGKIDVLVGTQMISKGHNFKRVNLVLILGIDSALSFADFRAQEKVYQLLTQVSGRAGRFGDHGKVMIQTLDVQNPVFAHIQSAPTAFFESEIALRKMCQCPPFSKLAAIYITSRFSDRVYESAKKAADMMGEISRKHFPLVMVLGPSPANIEKRANQFTWTILLRASEVNHLHNLLAAFEENFVIPAGITLKTDVDPSHFL